MKPQVGLSGSGEACLWGNKPTRLTDPWHEIIPAGKTGEEQGLDQQIDESHKKNNNVMINNCLG